MPTFGMWLAECGCVGNPCPTRLAVAAMRRDNADFAEAWRELLDAEAGR